MKAIFLLLGIFIGGTCFAQSKTFQLSGTAIDTDGTIQSVKWSFVSGPDSVVFSNANILNPTVTMKKAGTYILSLVATDNQGGKNNCTTDADPVHGCWIVIKVNPKPNALPVVDAGPDQEGTLQ